MRALEQFFFRYFSYSTLNNDKDNWLRYVVALILLTPALLGVVLDITGRPLGALISFLTFTYLFILFGITWIVVWIYHVWRIKHGR